MKKIALSITAVALLALSCANGSAASLENSDQELSTVTTTVVDKTGDDQVK